MNIIPEKIKDIFILKVIANSVLFIKKLEKSYLNNSMISAYVENLNPKKLMPVKYAHVLTIANYLCKNANTEDILLS
jgi:hypothetical protein